MTHLLSDLPLPHRFINADEIAYIAYIAHIAYGAGTTALAALIHQRTAIGAEIMPKYVEIARERVRLAGFGQLRIRPMERPVYDPNTPSKNLPPLDIRLGDGYRQEMLLESADSIYGSVQHESDL